jgi:energy-coupling factor transporter ATP-binding protein EcfA2
MYLRKIILRNIKCFTEFKLDFTEGGDVRRWTALLGKNGLGKSTLLQAIGVVLAGPAAVRELLPVAEGWVREGQPYGEIEAELKWTKEDALPTGRPKTISPYRARYVVTGNNSEGLAEVFPEYYTLPAAAIVDWPGIGTSKQRGDVVRDMNKLKQTAYTEGKPGWLGCGYGPFRRLSGGAQDADRILYGRRKSARFVTLFREDAALTNAEKWLIELYNTARDDDVAQQRALEQVKAAFAVDLFPQPTTLHLTARNALLQIGDRVPVRFQDLSDGYRSMLALAFDLLRWLIDAFPDVGNPMDCSGVVLIDELDAHAHPSWQREIGDWLRQKFPNIQFIVATHSPFLAQVADEPEGNIVLEDQGLFGVRPRADVEAVDVWRTDQILTELFDLPTTYKPKVEQWLKRHQELHRKQQERRLSEQEKKEYRQLTLWREEKIPPAIEDPEQRRSAQALRKSVQKHRAQLKDLS